MKDKIHPTTERLNLLIDQGVTFRMTGVANRLNRSASAFYRNGFGIGVQEWRLVLVLGKHPELTVGDAALAADLDTASASRALKALKDRDFVSLEMTTSRGRATIARLTDAGRTLHAALIKAGAVRAARIIEGLSDEELTQLFALLGRIKQNADGLIQDQAQAGQEL
ncbi:MAG: MarR family winged helix-turn-helix transcriptional regulator [Alphaproteobacteria bacterium]|uniref:DNA-binding transcriptional regulator, MarR family n=1 Tax=Celeribacter baekdonensis TaxID=875171 RepID=A0A1G7P4R7_9RHOB|nr:MarR family winged helix-turn-helix transcriptional regulator [Celeribacter baekdonensis]MBU0643738.1 MarR family winged helix-turn-helix transcriptional regulator [Alphaproteobacteria bacterium]MBU1281133.1 MarR family winged helix-turn-helix transcriptional regulator [Alphaproteobacteria bacterium]MBU1573675.1 MarR family winged helix-turn-helix transcriptional regulator [Alphaproteobacteria bacterium]MBU1827746.1 MarR family winged helix-turn-helix transcriptional regulator [Alphaproteoba